MNASTRTSLAITVACLLSIIPASNLLAAEPATSTQEQTTTRTLPMADARAKYATEVDKFVDIDGVNVHYRDEGKGPAILLMHGTLGDLFDWNTWAEELSDEFRVVRFDLPGFGLTGDMPNGNYSVDRNHLLIDGLMDHLGIEKFGVVGISYGGMVMFRYAATRTDRVTSMVLINSAGIQKGKPAQKKDTLKDGKDNKPAKNMFIEPIVTKADVEGFYEAYINDPAARTDAFIQRKLDYMNIQGRLEVSNQTLAFYEPGNPKRVLSHVKAPSLVMWGTANAALDTETAQTFLDYLTNACSKSLVTFDSGGHYINVERPQETVDAAKRFFMTLKNNPPASCEKVCALKD